MTFSANYYHKTTSNLLTEAYLPISHGYEQYKENMGTMRNTGYDITLGFTLIRKNDLNWQIRIGTYSNKNILVKLSDAIKKMMAAQEGNYASNKTLYLYKEGASMDEIYAIRSVGIDPLTGERLYVNDEGHMSTQTQGIKPVAVGNSQPKVNGRLGTSFRWKGLNVDLGFGCRLGGKKLNSTLLNKIENGNIIYNMDRRNSTLRWRKPGDVAAYKNLGSSLPSIANDMFVFTEYTFTFNSANITYQLPREWIAPFKMQNLSLTASLTDIFYLSNIEQERGTSYPYTIKPTFSVSCTF